jgi:superfamily II DNA/RNA helicase
MSGRLNALARDKVIDAKNVKHFVLDECNEMLEQLGQSCEFGAHIIPSSFILINSPTT